MNRWQDLSTKKQNLILTSLILLLALLPRLFGLDVFLTADEPKSWFGRSIQFLNALAQADWAATFDSPAPGVTTMWAGSIGLLLDYVRQGFPGGDLSAFLATVPFDPLDPAILPLVRLPIVLVAVTTVLFTYYWGQTFLGRSTAFLAASFIALNPFMLALSRILGHDALVAMFMWLSLLAFLRARAAKTGGLFSRRYLITSGALGGLAFLTKYPSLSLGAFIAVAMLLMHLRHVPKISLALQHWLLNIALWSAAAGIICLVLWPATWVDPVGTAQAIISDALRASSNPHQKGSFFLGQPVPDPGSSYYLLVTLFKTTPLIWVGWLLAFTLGWIIWLKRMKTSISGYAVLIILAYGLLYGLLVTMGGKKQDRYILPSFPAFILLAAVGYAYLQQSSFLKNRHFIHGLLAGLILLQLIWVLPHYPYYFTYYNPMLGGNAAAEKMMIVGWGEGMDEAARWLNNQATGDSSVVAWYSTTFEPYYQGQTIYKVGEEKISRTPKPGLAADYVVFYINQLQRELPSVGALQFYQAVKPAHVVRLNGGDYAWIYPSLRLQHIIEEEARLVGQAALLGYNLFDEDGQPVTTLTSNDTTIIQLYWEWQGKRPDEPIGLSLIDESGRSWGWGNLLGTESRLPFEQWQEGMVASDSFALSVLPGTPPGDYLLKAWIDRPSTGELVGVFPLNHNDGRVQVIAPKAVPTLADLALSQTYQVDLAADMTLIGVTDIDQFQDPWSAGQTRNIALFWQAAASLPNHLIRLNLVDSEGQTWADWANVEDPSHYPVSLWKPNETIRDPWAITLPPFVPPGSYQLMVQVRNQNVYPLVELKVTGRERDFAIPADIAVPIDAQFGSNINLIGLQTDEVGQLLANQTAKFNLVWQAMDLVEADYTVTVQLLDGHNQVWAQRDAAPLDGTAPTTSWARGEIISDQVSLTIPANIGLGPHRLLIALYLPETGQRVLLKGGQNHVEVPITVK